MKSLLVFFCLAVCSSGSLAQSANPSTDSLFIVTYTTGPAWKADKSPGEQIYFKEHSTNLGAWRKEGFITFGARYGEKGIIIVKAQSFADVRRRIFADPAVEHGTFHADVESLRPFYYGCVDKP